MADPEEKGETEEYVVKDGDRMSSIAAEKGYTDYNALYLAQPEKFRRAHPNPEILMPGDRVKLRPKPAVAKYSVPDKGTHHWVHDTKLPKLRIELRPVGKYLAGKEVTVHVNWPAPNWYAGKVKVLPDGVLDFYIDHRVKEVTLSFADSKLKFEVKLQVGKLRPIKQSAGVAQRLDNLGYRVREAPVSATPGAAPNEKDKAAHAKQIQRAVSRFREDHERGDLEATHEPPEGKAKKP